MTSGAALSLARRAPARIDWLLLQVVDLVDVLCRHMVLTTSTEMRCSLLARRVRLGAAHVVGGVLRRAVRVGGNGDLPACLMTLTGLQSSVLDVRRLNHLVVLRRCLGQTALSTYLMLLCLRLLEVER